MRNINPLKNYLNEKNINYIEEENRFVITLFHTTITLSYLFEGKDTIVGRVESGNVETIYFGNNISYDIDDLDNSFEIRISNIINGVERGNSGLIKIRSIN